MISTSSSFAIQQQEASASSGLQTFREIGSGYCGIVFDHAGTGTVIKQAKQGIETLWNDYLLQANVYEQFNQAESLFEEYKPPRIPRPIHFIPSDGSKWWSENNIKFPPYLRDLKTAVLCSERILPLPKPIREDLIYVFCPIPCRQAAKISKGNKDCIVLLYLGHRRSEASLARSQRFFSLRNFSLHLDMAEELCLDIRSYATEMAIGLALCHWRAKVDANDVEFVLGSAPTILNFAPLTAAQISALPQDPTRTARKGTTASRSG